MLRYITFAVVGVCLTLGQLPTLRIQYNSPQLILYFNIGRLAGEIVNVTFHYGVGNTWHEGLGVHSGSGGDYELHANLSTHPGDNINAFAVIHFRSGSRYITRNSTHHVGGGIIPLTRHVRAVTFRDDFNTFNQNNWHAEVSMFGGFNWEFQVYTPESKNIYVSGGHLYLQPTLTTDDPRWDENFLHTGIMDVTKIWGRCTQSGNYGCVRDGHNGLLPPVMSGKVSSVPTALYGTVEVRARIPRGDWLWPAIWMMPPESHYGDWPRSGEIDIMESRGNAGDIGVGTVSSTLHWGPSSDQNRYSLTHGEKHSGNYQTDYHTWRLDWTPDHLKIFIDNQLVLDVEVGEGFWKKGGFSGQNPWAGGGHSAPFDRPFFIMFNVAVGGTSGFFPDNVNWGTKKPWLNSSPHAAQDFWDARSSWLPSWQGDNTALIIDYVEFRS